MTGQGENVLIFSRKLVLDGQALRGQAHGQIGVGIGRHESRVGQIALPAHGNQGHRLDTAGDDHVLLARGDLQRAQVDRFQPRRAEPVDGHAGHFVGQAGHQGDVAPHVHALLTLGHGTAHDHVTDAQGVQAGGLRHDAAYGGGAEVVRPGLRE